MQTDKSIPYPRPNYKDKDLLTKELINGTFVSAIFSDLRNFNPILERYNVTEDILTNRSLTHGNIRPEDYDITMGDVTLDGVKETGWLPAKRIDSVPEPIVIYDPRKHYSFVEWVGANSTDLQDVIPSYTTKQYLLNIPYYDDDNAGLFGFETVTNEEGELVSRTAMFYSLKTSSMLRLGSLGNGYNLDASVWVGYVKGAYILRFFSGVYMSFTFDGEVHTLSGVSGFYTPLGDDETIAIESSDKTKFFDKRLTKIDEIEGNFCEVSSASSSKFTKYMLGTKIDNTYFFRKDDISSYKFRKTKEGWKAQTLETDIWKYGKMIKYDYATDNWLHTPLKTLKYNMRKQSLYVPNKFPKHKEEDEIEFPNSDMHGDFSRVIGEDGSRAYFHTFDFKKFSPLTGDAAQYLYGCMGRMWIKNRQDGVSGLMPYTIAVRSVNDLLGGKKTALLYSGFIFRGEAI